MHVRGGRSDLEGAGTETYLGIERVRMLVSSTVGFISVDAVLGGSVSYVGGQC